MLTILFAILSALYDKGKRFTDHKPRFIFRAIVVGLISLIGGGNFFINLLENTFIFYIIFDYLLNILEGRKWDYLGTTAQWDKIRVEIQETIPYFDVGTKIILLIITLLI